MLCREGSLPKLHRLLMMYDDQLRNPRGSTGDWEPISSYDYDLELAKACETLDMSHLVPRVCLLTATETGPQSAAAYAKQAAYICSAALCEPSTSLVTCLLSTMYT